MFKINYSSIFFLLVCIGLNSFAHNPQNGKEWSQPISGDLCPVVIISLPYSDAIGSDNYQLDYNQRSNSGTVLAAPCELPIGSFCDDGNPNTVNDRVAPDCQCIGEVIAETCEEFEITYQLGNGLKESAGLFITVNEGDSLSFAANAEDYIITDENGIEVNGNFVGTTPQDAGIYTVSTTFEQTVPIGAPLQVTSGSEEPMHGIAKAIDSNPNTYWQSDAVVGYPHEVVFDMGEYSILSGFFYLRRQDSDSGRIDDFDIYISNSTSNWGDPVIQNEKFLKDLRIVNGAEGVTFDARQGRYLKFVATTPMTIGDTKASAANFKVLRGPSINDYSSQEESFGYSGFARHAIDGDPETRWHSEYKPSKVEGPHYLTLDLGVDSNLNILEYIPRSTGEHSGNVTDYKLFVTNDPVVWQTNPDVEGTWLPNGNLKSAIFPAGTHGRYVKMVMEGLNGFALAHSIKAIGPSVNVTCTRTVEIIVNPAITYSYFENAWTPNTPEGNSTSNDLIIIAEGDVIFSGAVIGKNIIVEPGTSLTIDENSVVNSPVTLKSRSNSFSSLILEGEHIGAVAYERWVNQIGTSAGGGNDLVSSPVSDVLFNQAFISQNPALSENPLNLGEYAFSPFNVLEDAYQNFDIGSDRLGSFTLVRGQAYRVATTTPENKTGDLITFLGRAEKQNVSVPISDAPAGRAWNAVGNPYPSYLDFQTFFSANMNQLESGEAYQAIYGYNGKADDKWEIWNLSTTSITDLIAPGQGFFVKAKAGGGQVEFTPAMRSVGSSDDFIQGRAQNQSKVLSAINLTQKTKSVATRIYFIDGSSKGLDPGYDAGVFTGVKSDFSIFTHLLEDNNGLAIGVQSLPYDDFNDVTVPLGVKAKAGAELNISIDDLSTIPSNINVYLEDTETNTMTLLNAGAFTFTPTSDMNSADRFNVHYSARTLSMEDLESNGGLRIYAMAASKTLYIKGQLGQAAAANLYDIQGRLVLSHVLNPNTTENTMDISALGTGIYVVKVNNDNQTKTQKVVIK